MMFHLYGLFIGFGILSSASASAWLTKRRGLSPDIIWDGLWWAVVPAIIGARTYHVAHLWSTVYAADPLSALYLWNGGLALYGALAGGFLGLYLYWQISNFKFKISNLLNIAMFGLPLGQVIGRLGNYVNEELYGLPSSLPWAIPIDVANRVAGFEQYTTFHPLFLYEILWMLAGFLVMVVAECGDRSFISKSYAGFYLIWYGIGRFFLEFLRLPDAIWTMQFFGVKFDAAQLFSLLCILCGVFLWSLRGSNPRPPQCK